VRRRLDDVELGEEIPHFVVRLSAERFRRLWEKVKNVGKTFSPLISELSAFALLRRRSGHACGRYSEIWSCAATPGSSWSPFNFAFASSIAARNITPCRSTEVMAQYQPVVGFHRPFLFPTGAAMPSAETRVTRRPPRAAEIHLHVVVK
jgi:hypothetical protein